MSPTGPCGPRGPCGPVAPKSAGIQLRFPDVSLVKTYEFPAGTPKFGSETGVEVH